jgi:hypothetical protein
LAIQYLIDNAKNGGSSITETSKDILRPLSSVLSPKVQKCLLLLQQSYIDITTLREKELIKAMTSPTPPLPSHIPFKEQAQNS